jgi:hypothetical protein
MLAAKILQRLIRCRYSPYSRCLLSPTTDGAVAVSVAVDVVVRDNDRRHRTIIMERWLPHFIDRYYVTSWFFCAVGVAYRR